MTLAVACALFYVAAQVPAPAAASAPSVDADVRAAVQQYYDAQAARDPDKAAASWSASANPRMTRDTFVALFGTPSEDAYTVDVKSVTLDGDEARVRVMVVRTRVEARPAGPFTSRTSFGNIQTWRREGGAWKLFRDAPFADELADRYLAMGDAERPSFLAQQTPIDLRAIRYAVAQRASMAVTLSKDYVRGRTLFERALEIARAAQDRHSEANSLHNIGQADFFLRDFPAAVAAYERELAVAREIDDDDAASAAQFGLATVAYSNAEYTAALGFYREALTLYEKLDDGPSISRAVVSIGNVQYLQGEYDAAAASYRRGLAAAVQYGDKPAATYAKKGLARVLAAQGDVAAALDMYGQALADARVALAADPRLKSDVSATLESIGELHFRLGNTDQARTMLEEARRLASDGDPASLGRVLLTLGLTEIVAGRFDAALSAYGESRARFEQAKNDEGAARAWVGVGFADTAREQFTDAMAAYRTAITLFQKKTNEDGVARAWLGLSRAQSAARDEAAALESAATVSAMADRLKSDDLGWRAAERTGESLRKLKRLDEAAEAFGRAIAALDRLAADAPINAEARGDLNGSASVWAGLALTRAAQGDAPGALRAMEARRAHIRRADFAAFQHDIAPGVTADELAEEQALVREIASTRAQARAEAQSSRHDAARAARLAAELQLLMQKRTDQQARLYARLPDLPRWRAVTARPLEPDAIAALVPGDRGLIVAYLATDDELLTVTIARGESGPDITAQVTPFTRRAVAEKLSTAMGPAVLQDAAKWRTAAAPLAAALIDPIAPRLQARDRVVIIPDDLLWKVPFEALPMGATDLASVASVSYATSLATWELQRSMAAPMPHPVPAFLAAPAIPDGIRAQLQLTLPSWAPQDPDAAGAAAATAAHAYGDDVIVRSGAEASEAAARAALVEADVVHVQAPLLISTTAPLLSSLVLASNDAGAANAGDGRLEARDWFAMTARARVVVLPDGSAFGAAGVGNAMDAIAWSAVAAGVPALVLGRWPAEAFASDALAAALHANLAGGAALMDAWRDAVDAARRAHAEPSAWAGLRVIGGR